MRLKAEKIDLSKELEKRIGKRQLNRIIDKALVEARQSGFRGCESQYKIL